MAYCDLATYNAGTEHRLTGPKKDPGVMSNTPAVQAFWRDCAAHVPGLAESTPYTVKVFGNNPDMAKLLLNLIRTGQKTGTFFLAWEYEDSGKPVPAKGDWVLVTDAAGIPGCVYQITSMETVPFDKMEARHVQCEGPQLRDLDAWKKLHWDFWTQQLANSSRQPESSMPVLCMTFKCH